MAIKPLTHVDDLGRFAYLSTYIHIQQECCCLSYKTHQSVKDLLSALPCVHLFRNISHRLIFIPSLSYNTAYHFPSHIYQPRRPTYAPHRSTSRTSEGARFFWVSHPPRYLAGPIIAKMVLWQDTVPLLITNNCADTIWPGIYTTAGTGPGTGGFELAAGANRSLEVGSDWYGRVWGRTNCTSPSDGVLTCTTGSCGQMDCTQASVSHNPSLLLDICVTEERYLTPIWITYN